MDEFYKKQLSETHAKVQEAVKAIEAEEAKIMEVLMRVAQKKIALRQAMNDQAAREGVMADPEVQEEMADLETSGAEEEEERMLQNLEPQNGILLQDTQF